MQFSKEKKYVIGLTRSVLITILICILGIAMIKYVSDLIQVYQLSNVN